MKKGLVTGAVLSSALFLQLSLLATGSCATEPAHPEHSASAATPEASTESVKRLEAEVEVVQIDLAEIRDLGLDIKKVRNAASGLYDEMNRTPVTLNTTPNYIGYGTVINIPTSFSTAGTAMKPRKKSVDAAMAAIRPFVTLAKEDVDAFESGKKELDLPANVVEELQPALQKWRASIKDASSQLEKLENLTAGPNYENQAVSMAASALDSDMQQLEQSRRVIYKVLQREGKEAKRKEKSLEGKG